MNIAGTNPLSLFYPPLKGQSTKGQSTDFVCVATHLGPQRRKGGAVLSHVRRAWSGRHWGESWGSSYGMFRANIPGLHNNHLCREKLAPPRGKSITLPCEKPHPSFSGNPLTTTSVNLFAPLSTSFSSLFFFSFLFFCSVLVFCFGGFFFFFFPLPSLPSCILTLAKETAT